MLHTKSVDAKLLELLKFIMDEPMFSAYALVGGTSLALQIGHRLSVDIDLFGKGEIMESSFLKKLQEFGTTLVIN